MIHQPFLNMIGTLCVAEHFMHNIECQMCLIHAERFCLFVVELGTCEEDFQISRGEFYRIAQVGSQEEYPDCSRGMN